MTTPYTPEHDVSPGLARDLIAAQFPQLAPQRIERFGAGMDNIAYLVDEARVFRFPRREIIVPLLEIETAVLPLIAPHVPSLVPVPRFVGKPDDRYPWMFAGYDLLPGTTACTVDLSNSDRARLATALGTFLRALHRINPRDAIASGLPRDLIGRMNHPQRLPLAQQRFSELQSDGYVSNIAPFLDFMERHAPAELEPCAVVHGDLYARHLLVDTAHNLAGVIDWGDVHFGHPAVDLMIAHTMLPPSAHEAFIEAYGGVDPRTWTLAKYRAIYHSALVAHYGVHIGDAALRDAGLSALERIRETLPQ